MKKRRRVSPSPVLSLVNATATINGVSATVKIIDAARGIIALEPKPKKGDAVKVNISFQPADGDRAR